MLEHANAEQLAHALDRAWHRAYSGTSFLLEYAPRLIHLTTADRASANLRMEASLAGACAESEARIFCPCLTHLVSTVASQQYSLVKESISGCIAYALAQRSAGALDLLRSCLECLLMARLEVRLGPKHVDYAYTDEMAQLIFGDTAKGHKVRQLLNGDWRVLQIVHHCTCQTACDPVTLAKTLSRTLVSRPTPLFPRHRWTGADLTLQSILQVAVPHLMLETIMPVWLRCLRQNEQPSVDDFTSTSMSASEERSLALESFAYRS